MLISTLARNSFFRNEVSQFLEALAHGLVVVAPPARSARRTPDPQGHRAPGSLDDCCRAGQAHRDDGQRAGLQRLRVGAQAGVFGHIIHFAVAAEFELPVLEVFAGRRRNLCAVIPAPENRVPVPGV